MLVGSNGWSKGLVIYHGMNGTTMYTLLLAHRVKNLSICRRSAGKRYLGSAISKPHVPDPTLRIGGYCPASSRNQ